MRSKKVTGDQDIAKQTRNHNTQPELLKEKLEHLASTIHCQERELLLWLDHIKARLPKQDSDQILFVLICIIHLIEKYELDPLLGDVQCWHEDGEMHFGISISGLMRLLHRQPQFCGIAFNESPDLGSGVPHWIECVITRTGQYPAYIAREYFEEVKKTSALWQEMPRRMLKHRAAQQAARYAFGIEFHQSFSLEQPSQRAPSNSHFAHTQYSNLANGRIRALKEVLMHQKDRVGPTSSESGTTNTAYP